MPRDWRPLPVDGVADGLILFDGVCVFCSRWVQFVIARDRAALFRFAPVQQAFGAALAARLGIAVGGTGGFGRKLVEALAATTELDIVIASRNRARGAALAATLAPGRAEAIALDAREVTPAALRVIGAFAVVDAAGPFQGAD